MKGSPSVITKPSVMHKKKRNVRVVNYLSNVSHGLTLKPNTCRVQHVRRDGPSAYAGVRPGWMVAVVGGVVVNNKSVESVLAKAMKEKTSFKVLYILPSYGPKNKLLLSVRLSKDNRKGFKFCRFPGVSIHPVGQKKSSPQKPLEKELWYPENSLKIHIEKSYTHTPFTPIGPDMSINSKSNELIANIVDSSWDVPITRVHLETSPEKEWQKETSFEKRLAEGRRISVRRTTSYNKVLRKVDDMCVSTTLWCPGLSPGFSDGTIEWNFSDAVALTPEVKDDVLRCVESEGCSSPSSADGLLVNQDVNIDLDCAVIKRWPPVATQSTESRWEQEIGNTSPSKANTFDTYGSLNKPIFVGEMKSLDEDCHIELTDA